MLLNKFFYIDSIENQTGVLKALLRINKNHPIFAGHFPSIPIVPGVCMMQMVKEIMEQQHSQKMILREADNVKFLSVINPTQQTELQADIQVEELPGKSFKINATLLAGSTIYFKLKAILQAA